MATYGVTAKDVRERMQQAKEFASKCFIDTWERDPQSLVNVCIRACLIIKNGKGFADDAKVSEVRKAISSHKTTP